MGLFSRKSTSNEPAGREDSMVSDGPKVTPGDPGLAEDHPRQLAHGMLTDCGLSLAMWGPGSASDCFAAARDAAPVFHQATSMGPGFGTLPDTTAVWAAYESPTGAAVTVHCFPDSNADTFSDLLDAVRWVRAPYACAFAVLGGRVPLAAADILGNASVVPVWELPGMGHFRPEGQPERVIEAGLRQALLDNGWRQIAAEVMQGVFGTFGERTQAVLLGVDGDRYLLFSAFAKADEADPSSFTEDQTGPYEVTTIGDMIGLVTHVERDGLTYDALSHAGMPLILNAESIEMRLGGDRF